MADFLAQTTGQAELGQNRMSQLRETQTKQSSCLPHILCVDGFVGSQSGQSWQIEPASKDDPETSNATRESCVRDPTRKSTTTAQKSCRSTICNSAKDTRIFCFTTTQRGGRRDDANADANAMTDAHDKRGHARTDMATDANHTTIAAGKPTTATTKTQTRKNNLGLLKAQSHGQRHSKLTNLPTCT